MPHLSLKGRVPVRICIGLCFGYETEFLMLIWKMGIVFHKSKQALTRATLKKLSKKINKDDVIFCSDN